MDDARVRLRHRVIGRILDREQRHGDRRRAQRGPSALESSSDHCDSQARSVEKRAEPDRAGVRGLRAAPMKVQRGLRSFGSIAGSMKRRSHSVR